MANNNSDLITSDREAPLMERFYYQPHVERVYKVTPQAELNMALDFPYDWRPTDRRPAILFLFGGGWRAGTYKQFARQAAWLAARGMVCARADYRVRDDHGTNVTTCVQDAFDAMRWLRGNADDLGVDANRIVGAGGSAGGHLAACLATLPEPDPGEGIPAVSARPNALVLFNPALNIFGSPEIGAYLGDGDVAEELEPMTYLDGSFPPTFCWYGTADRLLVPARPFLDKVRALGCSLTCMWAEGADHGYFNDYEGYFEPSLAAMGEFLEGIGYL